MNVRKILVRLYKKITPWSSASEKIYALYVKMNQAHGTGKEIRTNYYCYKIEKKYQCRISPGAIIERGLTMPHPNGIVIGSGSKIGKNVTIYQQVTIGQNRNKYPRIGDNTIIYSGAKIIGDIHIGKNCIIGANAVVIKDAPDNSILGGIPAKIIKKRSTEDNYI